jgi:protein ImuB
MIACVLLPRFGLIAACGERRDLLRGPAALAPEAGGRQNVGEVSGAAEAHGVRAGMRLGEALSRCPGLTLVPPDPSRAEDLWETVLAALEGIGAEVEAGRSGEAFFEAAGLRGLHGSLGGTLAAARHAAAGPARVAAAPTRFAAYAAAARARTRDAARIVTRSELHSFLAGLPVSMLAARLGPDEVGSAELVTALERLGIEDLGALAALPEDAVADRFGPLGLTALRVARGREAPLRPRRPHDELAESLELPEAAGGGGLERALALLIDRLLAAPERRGRTARVLRLSAALAGGGSWRREVPLREPSAVAEILRLALIPRLADLPAPAASLSLRVTAFGPPAGDQLELAGRPGERRRSRLAEAVRQTRAAAGGTALLRVLEVDAGSRVPERRSMLTPFPDS